MVKMSDFFFTLGELDIFCTDEYNVIEENSVAIRNLNSAEQLEGNT